MASPNYTIGIDIGGTKMAAVLWNGEKVVADDVLATPLDNLEHFLVMVEALAKPLMEKAKSLGGRVQGVGLGVAGVIDYGQGKMLHSPNIPVINGAKLPQLLEKRLGMPVKMDNDANTMVRAEALMGAGKGYKNVFGIILGTGIGGAWWINNEVYLGAHGGAGEPGMCILDLQNRLNVEQVYHKLTHHNPAQVAEDAFRGDLLAEKTYQELGEVLGVAFANIVNMIDPEIIIINGGLTKSTELYLPILKKTMKQYIDSVEAAKNVKVVKGKLGKNAGAIGAALLLQN